MRLIGTSLAIAAVLAGSSAAFAVPATAATVRVDTRDLDLASDAGRHVLDGRIRSAVARVCPAERALDATMACRREAMAGVTAQLDGARVDGRPESTVLAYRK